VKNFEIKVNDDEEILSTINSNVLFRNAKLNILMDLINKINNNITISVDGRWGSGKTVFVKQLQFITKNASKISGDTGIEPEILNDFKDKNIVFYYNAWENDFHTSPLLSIMYKILNDYPEEKNQISEENSKFPVDIIEGIKTISHNFIKFDNIKSYSDIVDEIKTSEEIKFSLNKLIDSIVGNNNRIVIIIDELDRCKPNYAVNMLETIKHFYDNDKITFIVSTNNEQLSHMICKLYGEKFEGYEYLNKFYDFVITLDDYEIANYLKVQLNYDTKSSYTYSIIFELIRKHSFSFREINKFVASLDLIQTYLDSEEPFNKITSYYRYIFAPYSISLKIKDINKYNQFFSGKGLEDFISFLSSSDILMDTIDKLFKYTFNKDALEGESIDIIKEIYNDLVINRDMYNEKFKLNQNHKKNFFNIISLLGIKSK
jgi:nucleoside-triphosphatase THEP1